eukprot:CAMPEP_0179492164 /NCGR_PEP_ID=MMETSP0799-20121207/66596_1 /TAXON_ID=46947 /ORGANISM="Geminigera cryophila, Strain CCMP2564" /LENGTH=39 /DNA_ID= /DNA_START= /DNA_END= /DNA_ORIENTATION=
MAALDGTYVLRLMAGLRPMAGILWAALDGSDDDDDDSDV